MIWPGAPNGVATRIYGHAKTCESAPNNTLPTHSPTIPSGSSALNLSGFRGDPQNAFLVLGWMAFGGKNCFQTANPTIACLRRFPNCHRLCTAAVNETTANYGYLRPSQPAIDLFCFEIQERT